MWGLGPLIIICETKFSKLKYRLAIYHFNGLTMLKKVNKYLMTV